jgi:A/G-specific adenine glycosylase
MAKIKTTEILQWYEKNKRTLPWRKDGISPYSVWVSEIMLQQTQVARGIVFYERFLKKYPTVQKLAKTNWEEFLPYYEGLGYYNRGRNMLKTSKIIVQDFGGEFPKDKTALMKLPGIGEYTASAILSFAHDLPYIAFDTNFKKIFGTRANAEKAFRESGVPSFIFNSAIMDYASAHKQSLAVSPPDGGLSAKRTKPLSVNAIVVLHENHKKYFSENAKKYEPFILPKGIKTREQIKKYFLEKYGLRVSVRPPNKKGTINAQILSGENKFKSFTKMN